MREAVPEPSFQKRLSETWQKSRLRAYTGIDEDNGSTALPLVARSVNMFRQNTVQLECEHPMSGKKQDNPSYTLDRGYIP
jgi:hypothetical protein